MFLILYTLLFSPQGSVMSDVKMNVTVFAKKLRVRRAELHWDSVDFDEA